MVTDANGKVAISDVTSTELDILDGVTADHCRLNILDGVTATSTELFDELINYCTDNSTDVNFNIQHKLSMQSKRLLVETLTIASDWMDY